MTIKRPYVRQSDIYGSPHVGSSAASWSKENFDDSTAITAKLRNKTWFISPMEGIANKETHHHKIKVNFSGPSPRIILAHSTKPQLDEVRSTSYYSLGPYTMTDGIEIDIPMPYGGRKYTWIFIEDIPNLNINQIEHSYWRCPDGLYTYDGQEGPFFHDHHDGAIPYFVKYPNDYDSDQSNRYPLFISCAGSDTTGCDGKKGRNQVDPAWIIFRHHRNVVNHPAFLVTIQAGNCITGQPRPDLPFSPWHDGWYNTYGPEGDTAVGVLSLIESLINNPDYHIDTERIYMGGMSGGGKLAFSLLQSGRDVFAAVCPTSAWAIGGAYQNVETRTDWPELQDRLRKEVMRSIHIPTLVGVGTKDNMIYGSKVFKNMVDELGGNCRYQEYLNNSHGAAPKTCFNNFDNVDWIFSQIKNQTPTDPYPDYNFDATPQSSASSRTSSSSSYSSSSSSRSSSSSSQSSSSSSSDIYYMPGDINQDDFIGLDDLNVVLRNWNKRRGDVGFEPSADLNQDGFIGMDDLNVILANWNKRLEREKRGDSVSPE